VTLRCWKYRGPGTVTFDKPNPEVQKLADGNATMAGSEARPPLP